MLWGKIVQKNSNNAEKDQSEDLQFILALYCMLRGKKEKPFLVKLPGPTGTIEKFVELLIGLFWSLQVYRSETKSHDYSQLFS